jgi:hypothetical protein
LSSKCRLGLISRWTPGDKRTVVVRRLVDRQPQIHPHRLRIRRGAGAAGVQAAAVVGHAGGQGVGAHAGDGFGHQVGKRGQRHQLARGEQVAPGGQAVGQRPEVARIVRQGGFRLPGRLRLLRNRLVLSRGRQVHAAACALGHDGHQPRPHAAGRAFRLDVRRLDRHPRHQAAEVGAPRQLCALLRAGRRRAGAHLEVVAIALHHRVHPAFLARLAAQDEAAGQRHVHLAEGRVGAFDGARPQPGDDGELLARLQAGQTGVFQVFRAFLASSQRGMVIVSYEFRSDFDAGVEVADALQRLLAHPGAVAAHVFGQAARARPVGEGFARAFLGAALGLDGRAHRRAAGELGRDLDHGLVDGHGHGVEVAGKALQPQALRLQRQRAPARKRVVKGGQLLGVKAGPALVERAGLAPARGNGRAGAGQHGFVVGVLPQHQLAQDLEQLLALGVGLRAGLARVVAALAPGVVDHLRKDHRPRRRQRPPRPPQVQRAGVAVANGFLPRRRHVDIVQRQGDFDEFFGGADVHCSQGPTRVSVCRMAVAKGRWTVLASSCASSCSTIGRHSSSGNSLAYAAHCSTSCT